MKSEKMLISQKFNTFGFEEYLFYIDNHKQYKNFNTLGLYRSIIENDKLSLEDKLKVREYAHKTFRKAFDFLQLKDPKVFVEIEYLGQILTKGDEDKIWEDIIKNQQKILEDKRIKHRNFGTYSKHDCGSQNCVWKGVMIRQGSYLAYQNMYFKSDNHTYSKKEKSDRQKSDRKNEKQIILNEFESEF